MTTERSMPPKRDSLWPFPDKTTITPSEEMAALQRFIILSLIIIAGACNFFRSPGKDKCDKIVSREKMTDILTDVYLMEGYLQETSIVSYQTYDSIMYYYAGLFDKHGITRHIFIEALSCYLLNENDIHVIHDSVLQRLSILESGLSLLSAEPVDEAGACFPLVFVLPEETEKPEEDLMLRDWWRAVVPEHFYTPKLPSEEVLD